MFHPSGQVLDVLRLDKCMQLRGRQVSHKAIFLHCTNVTYIVSVLGGKTEAKVISTP